MLRNVIRLDRNQGTVHRGNTSNSANELPAHLATNSHPFAMVHYPRSWAFDPKRGFIPTPRAIKAMPAANGVTAGRDMSLPLGRAQTQKGGTIIINGDPRLERFKEGMLEGGYYVQSYPCANGGEYFCYVWDEFELLANGDAVPVDNSELFFDFCVFLRDEGIVQPMQGVVFNELMDRARKKLSRLNNRAGQNPHIAPAIEAQQERIKAMEKAWGEYTADLQAVAPRSRPKARTHRDKTPTPKKTASSKAAAEGAS